MEAGQLLVLLLSFCALALHFKNRNRKDYTSSSRVLDYPFRWLMGEWMGRI